MLLKLRKTTRLESHVEDQVRLLLDHSRPELPSPGLDREEARRCAAVVLHSYRLGAASSLRRGLSQALAAYRYYRGPLALHLIEASVDRQSSLPELNPQTCVRLVPAPVACSLLDDRPLKARRSDQRVDLTVSRSLGQRLWVISTPEGDLVVSHREVFVPTVYYDLDPNLVSVACDLRATLGTLQEIAPRQIQRDRSNAGQSDERNPKTLSIP